MNNNGRQIFVPPLLSEVKSFIEENNLNVDANYWYEYYQDRKWLINGKQIQNWKGLVMNWHKTQFDDKTDENKIKTDRFGQKYDDNGNLYYEEQTDLEALCLSLFGKEKGKTIWEEVKKERKKYEH